MQVEAYRFGEFRLDPANRTVSRAGEQIDLSGRYFDALALLVAEPGQLIAKERFFDEVWHGVPVTDEALTQCIKELRKALGDNAGSPDFIQTVPKYGYRFVAVVERAFDAPLFAIATAGRLTPLQRFLVTGLAGMAGGAVAGCVGGLIYGFAAAANVAAGGAALSSFVILWLLTLLLATLGGAGVGFGIAAARHFAGSGWASDLAGGALGGIILGGLARLLGHDAFILLFGSAPAHFTGAFEGALLGAAAAVAVRFSQLLSFRRGLFLALVIGQLAGLAIILAGGHLLSGSLTALAKQFPQARLRLDGMGALFGEAGLGPVTQAVTTAAEAGLFCLAVAAALTLAGRHFALVENRHDAHPKALA